MKSVMEKGMQKFGVEDIVPVLVRIQPSPKYGGVGVFAMRDIDCGTVLCDAKKVADQVHISWAELADLDAVTRKYMLEFCAQDEEGIFSPQDLNYLPVPAHMNHHCEANAACDVGSNFVAIMDIKKGEEIFLDYSLLISNPAYSMKCACGSKKCRKLIRSL